MISMTAQITAIWAAVALAVQIYATTRWPTPTGPRARRWAMLRHLCWWPAYLATAALLAVPVVVLLVVCSCAPEWVWAGATFVGFAGWLGLGMVWLQTTNTRIRMPRHVVALWVAALAAAGITLMRGVEIATKTALPTSDRLVTVGVIAVFAAVFGGWSAGQVAARQTAQKAGDEAREAAQHRANEL